MIRSSIAAGCILFGSVLMYAGYEKTRSFTGEISRTFSGGYSTATMAYLVGGGVLVMVGLVLLLGKTKR